MHAEPLPPRGAMRFTRTPPERPSLEIASSQPAASCSLRSESLFRLVPDRFRRLKPPGSIDAVPGIGIDSDGNVELSFSLESVRTASERLQTPDASVVVSPHSTTSPSLPVPGAVIRRPRFLLAHKRRVSELPGCTEGSRSFALSRGDQPVYQESCGYRLHVDTQLCCAQAELLPDIDQPIDGGSEAAPCLTSVLVLSEPFRPGAG